MTVYKNFKKYDARETAPEELVNLGVTFLVSDEGKDWYLCQKDFEKDLIKVGYDPSTKVIKTFSYDVSSMFPEGMSVADVSSYPKRFLETQDISQFVFNESKGIISTRTYSKDEKSSQAEYQKKLQIAEAMAELTPLQFAKEQGIATDEELENLKLLQIYVVELNRISKQEGYPTKINWPVKPETK